jgi:hypothetical protein
LIKWPLNLPDGELEAQKKTKDSSGAFISQRLYDNFVPGFFWDMAQEVSKDDRMLQATSLDETVLVDRLAAALDLEG